MNMEVFLRAKSLIIIARGKEILGVLLGHEPEYQIPVLASCDEFIAKRGEM